ncbi:iojap-like protein [Chloroherpeton thalassium ATCC 35110]|uniref:Ribosomal silencing factor RsfS n=1 Tax=Chloroherpeton thalassium (strain ATCC 35110 / GB-78) TaxID=517418 RepID=B3QSE4_CHLT3|nr:ribosome silencing factor [Chloroherpeton thalassium]ACF12535.1 iojap-like protein [Chloroherpeton thalassium ATCC 35110]
MEIKTSLRKESHFNAAPTGQFIHAVATSSSQPSAHLSSEAELLARRAAELAFSKKGYDVVIMDLRKVAEMTDFFVICTADSDTQVKAVADAIIEGLHEDGEKPYHVEGTHELSWVLIDYVDVVIHVFLKETRSFYSLEKLWGDAEFERIKDPVL